MGVSKHCPFFEVAFFVTPTGGLVQGMTILQWELAEITELVMGFCS